MLAFWILVILIVAAIGFLLSYLFGEKVTDKADKIKSIYTKEKSHEEREKEDE